MAGASTSSALRHERLESRARVSAARRGFARRSGASMATTPASADQPFALACRPARAGILFHMTQDGGGNRRPTLSESERRLPAVFLVSSLISTRAVVSGKARDKCNYDCGADAWNALTSFLPLTYAVRIPLLASKGAALSTYSTGWLLSTERNPRHRR